ncbi:MAG: hypothetical protein JWQ98_1742 [Chlorobi bacterium]|nr:hypothetical protein [Chlorobiota bacterium]
MMNDTDIHKPDFDPDDIRPALEDALATGSDGIVLINSLEAEGYDRDDLIRTLASIPDPTKRPVAVITLALLFVAVNLFATIMMHIGMHIGSYVWICALASLAISVEVIRMRAYIFRVAAICCLGFAVVDLKYANHGGVLVLPLVIFAAMLFYYIGFNLFPYYTLTGPTEARHGVISGRLIVVVFLIITYPILEGIFGVFPVAFFNNTSHGEQVTLYMLVAFPPVLFILAAITRKTIDGLQIRAGMIITEWLWLAFLAWTTFAVTPWREEGRHGGSWGDQSLKPVISYSFGGFLALSMLLRITSPSEKLSLRGFAREHGPFLLYLLLIWMAQLMADKR